MASPTNRSSKDDEPLFPWKHWLPVAHEVAGPPTDKSNYTTSSVCVDLGFSKSPQPNLELSDAHDSQETMLRGFGGGSRAKNIHYQGDPDIQEPVTEQVNKILSQKETWIFSPEDEQWLPFSRLCRIFDPQTVQGLLEEQFPNLDSDSDTITNCVDHIFNRRKNSAECTKANNQARCIRLFAVLFQSNLVCKIIDLLEEGMVDTQLPVTFDGVTVKRRDGKPLKAFESCDLREIQAFILFQWWFLAPFFAKGNVENEEESSVLFYPFTNQRIILPWTEWTDWGDDNSTGGSFGKISRVKIHRAHHNLLDSSKKDPWFAIKKLKSHNKKDLDKEVHALRLASVNANKNDNVVNLLSTFQWRNSFYMIFPWADCNLREFWEKHDNRVPSFENMLWVARQCRGIASGLDAIHRVGKQSLKPGQPKETVMGRHGDIKPENVLWYSPEDQTECLSGVLRISDLGLAEFHRRKSQYVVHDQIAMTPTYRAPEVDLGGKRIGPPFDVWSLGCLYLEFITWYLRGYEDVWETFCDRRIEEDPDSQWKEDTFFLVDELPNTDRSSRAQRKLEVVVKRSVLNWIRQLHGHQCCTYYIHDFLDYIEGKMLQVEPEKRDSSHQVLAKLDQMLRKGERDESYLTEPRQWPIMRLLDSEPLEPSTLSKYALHCRSNLDHLATLSNTTGPTANCDAIQDIRGRFQVWGSNIGAFQPSESKKSLDHRVRDAKLIRESIASTFEMMRESCEQVTQIMSNMTLVMTDEAPEPAMKYPPESMDELQELLRDLQLSITHLFTLSMLLRRHRPRGRAPGGSSRFDAGPDITYIGDRFPKAKERPFVMRRLGNAIAERRHFIRYRHSHVSKLAITTEDNAFPGDSDTVATTFQVESLQEHDIDKPGSIFTSATSFASWERGDSSIGRRIPALLEMIVDGIEVKSGEPFVCPYCRTPQKFAEDNGWRTHAMSDLQPYICLAEDCTSSLFSTRREWAKHQTDSHCRQWECFLCKQPQRKFETKAAVSTHLNDVHSSTITARQIPYIADACEKVTPIPAHECPLCDEWKPHPVLHDNSKSFLQHLGRHMKTLALESIPLYIEGLVVKDIRAENLQSSGNTDGSDVKQDSMHTGRLKEDGSVESKNDRALSDERSESPEQGEASGDRPKARFPAEVSDNDSDSPDEPRWFVHYVQSYRLKGRQIQKYLDKLFGGTRRAFIQMRMGVFQIKAPRQLTEKELEQVNALCDNLDV